MLLFLAACAPLHAPSAGVPAEGAPPPTAGEPSLLDGPAAVAGMDTPAAPAVLGVLDEAALGALLRNEEEGLLVVNFWATWCGPCVREMSVFREVAAQVPRARFALVSVDAVRDRPVLLPFLASHRVALPAYHLDSDDPASVLARLVPAWPDIIPVTLVIEPGGSIRARFEGALDADGLRGALGD